MSSQQPGSLASVIDEKLIELEHECDSMTHEEVCEQFQGYNWDLLERHTGERGVFTVVNGGLSDKGMRHFLALLELEEFAFSDDDGGEERREPVMSACEDPTDEIDPGLNH